MIAPGLLAATLAVPPGAASGSQTVSADQLLLGLLRRPARGVVLTRLDPATFAPSGGEVGIGEYHYAWSFSPDSTRLAVAMSAPGQHGRIGVRIVDLERMTVATDVEGPIAPEAIGWVTPGRLLAALQNGELLLADTTTGAILGRRRLPLPPLGRAGPQLAAVVPEGFLMLLSGGEDRVGPAHLALADAEGGLRSVALAQVPLGRLTGAGRVIPDGPGLAVDPEGHRAFVVASRAPIAEVDLTTMSVTYRPLPIPLPLGCPQPATPECGGYRRAAWLGRGRLAVFGLDALASLGTEPVHPQQFPSGVSVVDTSSWTAWTVKGASRASFHEGNLLVYGGRPGRADGDGPGLGAFTPEGRPLYHVLPGEYVWDVYVAGNQVYAGSHTALRILDASGRILRKLPPQRWFELLPAPWYPSRIAAPPRSR